MDFCFFSSNYGLQNYVKSGSRRGKRTNPTKSRFEVDIVFSLTFDANMLPFWLPKSLKISSWGALKTSSSVLEASWGVLCTSWTRRGASWRRLGGVLVRLGRVLKRWKPFHTHLGPSWEAKPSGSCLGAVLEPSWKRLRGVLGKSLGVLEASWGRLGGVLWASSRLFGPSCGPFGASGGVLEASCACFSYQKLVTCKPGI